MKLRFESQIVSEYAAEVSLLVDLNQIRPDEPVQSVALDGEEIELDEELIKTFQDVVSTMQTEVLPQKNFRDCVHFVMAMSGVWLPTCSPFYRGQTLDQVCDDSVSRPDHEGPVAMGIPNDERCLGFGDARFVYSHSVFGVETNRGILYLQKLGTGSRYALMAPQQTLSIFDHEVAHPIKEVTVAVDDQRVQWQAE